MCRILGDCLKDGIAAKLADDLYCGADSPEELLLNWKRILDALRKSNIKLSPSKTVICPHSTTILGWVWTQGCLSARQHRIATLSSCSPPVTVRGLRSFIGAYKILGRVFPQCAHIIAPLESSIAGLQSQDKIKWSETLPEQFKLAQTSLSNHKSIALPKPSDKLWQWAGNGRVCKQTRYWCYLICVASTAAPPRWLFQCQVKKAPSELATMRN